jgi:hypothetical protein
MMKLNNNFKNRDENQTIVVLVECLQGGLKAGQFVLNHLYTDKSRLVLLQVYKVQGAGHFLMRDLSKILKSTALEDLTIVKNKLIEKFNIAPDKIEKMVAEGDVATILKREFHNGDNTTVVIGEDTELLKHKIPQKQISAIMKDAKIANILYIEDNITLINDSRIVTISEDAKKNNEKLKNYFTKLSEKYSLEIENIDLKSKDILLNADEAPFNISSEDSLDNYQDNAIETIFKKTLINTDV